MTATMTLPALPAFTVGVDPGRQTGAAILRRSDDKVLGYGTYDFFTVQDHLAGVFPNRTEARVIVEVNPTFTYKRNDVAAGRERDARMKMQAGVRREAQLLAEALRRLGFDVLEVLPVPQKKWDERHFQLFTKTNRKANQHEMDAIRLAKYYMNFRAEMGR